MAAIEAHVSTRIADEDLASTNAGCAGNHVGLLAITGFNLPLLDPGFLIDSDQSAIRGADDDQVLVECEPPVQTP